MSRRFAAALLGAMLVLLVAAPVALGQEDSEPTLRIEQVDAREFPTIQLIVTPPEDLFGVEPDPSSITVTENGVERPASSRILTDRPLRLIIAIDTSGSMSGDAIAAAKDAAVGFVESMPPTTEFAVLGFGSEPSEIDEFTTDRDAIESAITALEAQGETALFDAVAAALDRFAFTDTAGSRPYIVLLSDGGDTVSVTPLEEILLRLSLSDIGLYAVALDTAEAATSVLEEMTEQTSGRVVSAEDPEALQAVYDTVASELTNQILITYTTIEGGSVDVTVAIQTNGTAVTTDTRFTLPEIATPTTVAPTTTQVTTTTIPRTPATTLAIAPPSTVLTPTPPDVYAAEGGGALGADWALTVGIVAMGIALLVGLLLFFNSDRPAQTLERAQSATVSTGGFLARLAGGGRRAFDRALRDPRQRQALAAFIEKAGMTTAPGEFLVVVATGFVIGAAIGLAFGGFAALGGALIGTLVPFGYVSRRMRKRQEGFQNQLESTLQLIAGNLRAGYGVLQAISTVANEAEEPTAAEFSRIVVETRLGRDLVESLAACAERVGSQDFEWVVQAIDIQRSVGGDLAEVLDTVAETIRDRNHIRRQVAALSAEGRISGIVLGALPVVVALGLTLLSPDFLKPLFQEPAGQVALFGGLVLMGLGVVWIRRIVKIKF